MEGRCAILVLSRRIGEWTIITTQSGEVIKVKVNEIVSSEKIKLAFEADRSISIMREELLEGNNNG